MAAEVVQIPGSSGTAKIRSIWWVPILSIITVGIYFAFWYYYINREMRDLGQANRTEELGDSPGKSVLAVTLGALIIVPALVSLYHTGQRIQRAQKLAGVDPQLNGWLAVILYIVFAPIMVGYFQSELNKVWERAGQPGTVMTPGTETPVEGTSGFGPGATTPSQQASDAASGAGQPGSAATIPPGTGSPEPATPSEEKPPPTPPRDEPPA
jgi:hypothetical protein